jgi:hypothetical protein
VTELLLAIGLYALWESIPRQSQRNALTWFWAGVLLLGVAGLLYTIAMTGSIPSPLPGE